MAERLVNSGVQQFQKDEGFTSGGNRGERGSVSELPPYVIDSTGLPNPAIEVHLLGIPVMFTNKLLGAKLTTIRELYDMPQDTLQKVARLSEYGASVVRRKLDGFRDKLVSEQGEQSTSAHNEVTVNAIEWFARSNVTWKGIPKSSMVTDIEAILEQDIGVFIYKFVQQNTHTFSQIVDEVNNALEGEITVAPHVVQTILHNYGFSLRYKGSAVREKGKENWGEWEAHVARAQRVLSSVKRNTPVTNTEVQLLIDSAITIGYWEEIDPRRRFILLSRHAGDYAFSYRNIAIALKVSPHAIEQLEDSAISKLEEFEKSLSTINS